MNDQIAPPLADEAAFASLAALKAAHADLLQRRRAGPETPALLDDIATLVRRGQGTGVLLDDDDERAAAQSLLNYWANILYRAGREPPDATLAEFDPRLAPKLPDELCPYLGLEAFRENNHDLFFGRQQLVDELVERLKTHRLLAVVAGGQDTLVVRAPGRAAHAAGVPTRAPADSMAPFSPGRPESRSTAPSAAVAVTWSHMRLDG